MGTKKPVIFVLNQTIFSVTKQNSVKKNINIFKLILTRNFIIPPHPPNNLSHDNFDFRVIFSLSKLFGLAIPNHPIQVEQLRFQKL